MNIKDLYLSERAVNLLMRNKIDTTNKLLNTQDKDIRSIRGIGSATFKEIVNFKNQLVSFQDESFGWVDINNGLPAVGENIILTILNHEADSRELVYPACYMKDPYNAGYGFFVNGKKLHPIDAEVLAWMKFPDIYWD